MKKQTLLLLALMLFNTAFSQVSFIEHIIGDNGLGYMEDSYAADIDGDGDLDVILAHEDNISWFNNLDGLGNFGNLQTITSTLNSTQSVYAIDLDGDNDLEVLAASKYDNKISWYANDGSGNFGIEQIISTNAYHASSVYAIDLDGDNDMDVLSASLSDNKIAWYQNDGNGNFGAQQIITSNAGGAEKVYAADIDNDGDQDVLSASYFDDKIAWYQNDGSGIFGTQNIIGIVDGANDVFPTDIDSDGDIDVLTAAIDDSSIDWFENTDGMGSFGSAQNIQSVIGGGFSVYAEDMDGDTDMDVVYGTDTKIAWHKNSGQGIFGGQEIVFSSTFGAAMINTCDINNDNKTDILGFYPSHFSWFENNVVQSVIYNKTQDFAIYPNPSHGKLIIDSELHFSEIGIYDVLGKPVLSETNSNHIDITSFKSGIYYLRLKDVHGNLAFKKVIKE